MNEKLTPEDIHRLLNDGSHEELASANKQLRTHLAFWMLSFVGFKIALYLGIAAASKWARSHQNN